MVEVLATRNKRSTAARALLKKLSDVIRDSDLSSQEETAIRNGLGNLKQESISGACSQFVARYASTKDVTFVCELLSGTQRPGTRWYYEAAGGS